MEFQAVKIVSLTKIRSKLCIWQFNHGGR